MKSKDYLALEELSPYSTVNNARLKNPKQVFKWAARYLEDNFFSADNINSSKNLARDGYSIIDVGCANGEFLHFYHNHFKQHNFAATGIDLTELFIQQALSLNLPSTLFECRDLFELDDEFLNAYDIVTCFGTVPVFGDPKLLLERLLGFVRPGGVLVADGLFNRHDIDVQIKFCDNSTDISKGLWRSDFNQHSYTRLDEILKPISRKHNIFHYDFEADIPKIESAPAINVWTLEDSLGKKIVVNGANLLVNPSLLAVEK